MAGAGPQPVPLADMPGHNVLPVPVRSDGAIAAMSNPMYKGIPPYTGAWADAAYDPELPGPIYNTDQVKVESQMDAVMRAYTKKIIREHSQEELSYADIIEISRKWFTAMAAEGDMPPES